MKDETVDVFIFLVGMALGCVIAWSGANSYTQKKMQNEAVAAGHAHYEADDSGNVKFIWNKP